MTRTRVVLVSALCALACESSPTARTIGVKAAPTFNRDSVYRAYLHDQELVHRAYPIADADPRTIAAYSDFLRTLPPEVRAWWDSARAQMRPPLGLGFGDSTIARAFRRYHYAWGVAWSSAVDSEVWAEGPRKWWVRIAITDAADFPSAGRLYRQANERWHDVIVLRRPEVTSERILTALQFTRANWTAQGLTPSSSSVVDIAPGSDTSIRAGVGPITAAWVINQLANTHGAVVVIDSLGMLPATGVYLPIPRTVRLKGPA